MREGGALDLERAARRLRRGILSLVNGSMLFLLVLIAIVALTLAYYVKKKRQDELEAFAARYHFQLTPSDPFSLLDHPFPLFRKGDGRGIENVLSGRWRGMPVKAADYWYYTESEDSDGNTSRSYQRFSIAISDIPAYLPEVSVKQENIVTRLADRLGWQDINFESEDFNSRYQVTAKDREFAFKLIDARVMQWLLSVDRRFSFETSGNALLVYCRRLPPTDLVPLIGTAKEFRDRIPRIVWNQYGTGEGPAGDHELGEQVP